MDVDVATCALGDERDVTRMESWVVGLTVTDCYEFVDGDDVRWRALTFSNGQMVQMPLTTWLILETPAEARA